MRICQAALCALLLITLSACDGKSDSLDVLPANKDFTQAHPLSWWSRAAMNGLMRYSVWSSTRSGFITMFARDGVPVYSNAVGWKDIASEQPMTLGTHVRIASMTKPITAVVAMTLIEEGRLGLEDPVARYLPAFANLRVATSHTPDAEGNFAAAPAQTILRVKHLLMFASGVGPGRQEGSELVEYWDERGIYEQASGTLSERVNKLAELPLLEEPGTQWRYGFSADVLGAVIEQVTGKTLEEVMSARIFAPLGMTSTRYLTPQSDQQALATVYTQNKDKKLVPASLTFDNSWTPAGGGLVSTISDYMRFALMLWNEGEYQGTRILQASTVQNMRSLHVPDGVLAAEGLEGLGWGLGVAVVADEDASITPDNNGDFWWAGYFGTTFFISPDTGLVGVVMTQNEPGEFSGDPVTVFLLQGLAFAGM